MNERVGGTWWVRVVVLLLVTVMVGEVVHAIRGESLSWDEGDHIFAGYESWKTHDFGLNPEHPPLVKLIATLPLLPLHLKVPPLRGRFFKTESYMDGRELLYRNAPTYSAATLIFRVRLFTMVFTILAALLVFCAGREMFGTVAGLLALGLFCFEPNLLAHGAYVATDMGASCTIFATVYAFWRWTRRPTWGRLVVVGVAAGVALATKHSTVLLLPMLVVLAGWRLLHGWVSRRGEAADMRARMLRRGVVRMVVGLAVIVVVGVAVLWVFYGFRYAARPAGLALSPTLAAYVGPLAGVEARGILLAAKLRVLPESWLYGLADVRSMANGMPSYFFGRVYAHGVWFYFPVLFTIKTTLGMMALLLLTALAWVRGWMHGHERELGFLTIPPAIYLLVAMGSHLNIGARHILPVWVFCCVIAGAGAATLGRRGRGWAAVVGVLLLAHAGSSLWASPNYIAYANEAWGGPKQTYRYLSDSNTDWGQQLMATSAYLRRNGVKQCWFAYFVAPFVLPEDYGIPCKRLPTYDTMSVDDPTSTPPVIEGTVLISAGSLNGFEFGSSVLNPYESFRSMKPVAYVQDGVFVYRGSFAVPLAAALGHVVQSTIDLKAKDVQGALREAKAAAEIAPGEVQPEIAYGDALAADGQKAAAASHYQSAMERVDAMEPDAQETWTKTVAAKTAALR